MKFFWFMILFFFICSIQEHDVSNYNINPLEIETEKEISFHNQIYLWYELSSTQKINLIIKMIDIGDGGLKYQIQEQFDEDSTMTLMAKELIKIKDCMDNDGYVMYLNYKSDLEIGVALLECFDRIHMFRD